jgi:cytochrome c oxidase subunit 1
MTAATDIRPAKTGFKLGAWVFATGHKRVGILYLIMSMAAFLAAGLMAIGIRIEQYAPGESGLIYYFAGDFRRYLTTADAYNGVLHFHGMVMILGFLIPGLTGFAANVLVPAMIGARNVVSPRLNALTVWLFFAGAVAALLTLFIPSEPDAMWTGYAPYQVKTAGNTAYYVAAVVLIGLSSFLSAANLLATIAFKRAPGMGWNQLNMFVWTAFGAFIVQLVFVPVLTVAMTGLLLDKYAGTGYFVPLRGGDPMLYENLFWLYSYPAVYVIFLPAMGLLFDIAATMAKKAIFNYEAAAYAAVCGIAALFAIWLFYVFAAGVANWLRTGMMLTTVLFWGPVSAMLISLLGTLYKGTITFNVAMMYAAASILFLLLGISTGILQALPSGTAHLARTSFAPAHFHFLIGLFAAFSMFASVYFWFPKMTGRSADNAIAKIAFWFNLTGTQLTFWPLLIIGVQGMPRRYWDYPPEVFGAAHSTNWEFYHHIATYGVFITAAGVLLMVIGWVRSAIAGPKTNDNPWGSRSLEWTHTATPIGPGNFKEDPAVGPEWTPYNYARS